MIFEWDGKKATANARKHGISFREAASAFYDRLSVTDNDPDHSLDERRLITIGMSSSRRLLVIGHTDRGDRIRIITARLATRAEKRLYEEDK